MSNARHDHWVDEDNTGEVAPEEPTVGSRRLLLGGTAGSMAMAASGLFLPEWLEETEAREGALGGARGGRRGKDRRGRHGRRTHGDRKDKNKDRDKPRGSGPLFRSSALRVTNHGREPLQCTFYYRTKTGLDDYALPTANGTRTINHNQTYRYDPDRYRVGVLITKILGSDDLYADVRNVSFWFPRGGVTQGSSLDPQGGNFGAAVIPEQNFRAHEQVQVGKVVLKRNDDWERIEWELFIL